MRLFGDYHTHTRYSHGYGTIEDNVKVAVKKGLKEIAITDHGFNHKYFKVLRKNLPLIKRQINDLENKYDIKILLGIEANLIGQNGEIDLTQEELEHFDIVLMGFHKAVYAASINDRFTFLLPNFFGRMFGFNNKLIQKNTNAYIKAIKSGHIDIVTHLNYGCKVDVVKVAKECKKQGVLLELNAKRIYFSKKEIKEIIKTGVKFVINSDAHSKNKVGHSPLGFKFALKYNIPITQIANINKLPKFKN